MVSFALCFGASVKSLFARFTGVVVVAVDAANVVEVGVMMVGGDRRDSRLRMG